MPTPTCMSSCSMGCANLTCVLLLLLIAVPDPAFGQVYKHIGADGKVLYSDQPPAQAAGAEKVLPQIRSRAPGPDNDPVQASMKIYANETMVEAFYRFCRDAVPKSESELRIARDAWNARHAGLARKKITILHDHFSVDQLRKIANEMEATHQKILQTVSKATVAEKTAWCEAAPKRFEAPEVNPASNPTLVSTLETYKPKSTGR